MIPKILHHVWLNAEPPSDRLDTCKESFIALHPDWELCLWTHPEQCFVPENAAIREREAKILDHCKRIDEVVEIPRRRLAFKADILRVAMLYIVGGVYVDHDMYCLKPIDPLLNEDCILMQFRENKVGEGIIGFKARDDRLLTILDTVLYDSPRRINGLQIGWLSRHYGWKTFPPEYFCPHPRLNIKPEDKYRMTENTYMVHLWHEYEYDFERLEQMSEAARGMTV